MLIVAEIRLAAWLAMLLLVHIAWIQKGLEHAWCCGAAVSQSLMLGHLVKLFSLGDCCLVVTVMHAFKEWHWC